MIRDAPILILDEPTTGLDAEAAERVLAPLRRLMHGRTTIIITHDLATVHEADAILVLDRGRVAEYGTHAQLLAQGGTYANLYRLHHPDAPTGMSTPTWRPREPRGIAPPGIPRTDRPPGVPVLQEAAGGG
jgi:ATP-binding cassette subfamily B protein